MANPEITNEVNKELFVENPVHTSDVLTTSGAANLAEGTMLARNTTTKKLVPYASGGSGGAEVPVAVLTYPMEIAGAGDNSVRALRGGVVADNVLVEHGVGVITDKVVLDTLIANSGIVPISTQDLGVLDNQ